MTLQMGRAAEYTLLVPAGSPAYVHLHLLNARGLLAPDRAGAMAAQRLTHYDFAVLLVEPLERMIALVEGQGGQVLPPEQRRRYEFAYQSVSPLTREELHGVLRASEQLLSLFNDELEQLAPGLCFRAESALRKLSLPAYTPWIKPTAAPAADQRVTVSLTTNPELDSVGMPLPSFLPSTTKAPPPSTLFFLTGKADPDDAIMASFPVNTLEAAVAVTFKRFRLYGMYTAVPSADFDLFQKPLALGRAKVGVQIDIGHLNDFGVSALFETHIQRTPEAGATQTQTGAAAGIGLTW
jgi:hypothetical protein